MRLLKPKPIDYKKVYYFLCFRKIPYKDFFIFSNNTRVFGLFARYSFFVYGGRFWFKFRITRWMRGLSVKYFIWPKKPAIYKKKNK